VNTGTAWLLEPQRSIERGQKSTELSHLRREESINLHQVPEEYSAIASRSHIVIFDPSRISCSDVHKLHRARLRGSSYDTRRVSDDERVLCVDISRTNPSEHH
jgi:hypothetical protein